MLRGGEWNAVTMPADMFPGMPLAAAQTPQLLGLAGDRALPTELGEGFEKKALRSETVDQRKDLLPPAPQQPLLPPELARRAQEELNENPDTVHEEIEKLRSLVADEKNLHIRTDDAFLLRFLRARKFDVRKAFHMLQRYYVMKLRCPELFKVPRPSEKMHILEMQAQNMLEDRDALGRRVYVFRVDRCDAANVSIEDIFRTNVLALEHIADEPETQVAGLAVVVDMSGFGLQHARFLSPYYARRTVEVIQETFPLRFKGFHVINQPFYFDAVFAVLKPFLKDKIRRRIYFHGADLGSLHAFVSPDILPQEYGGKKPPFDNTAWRQSLLDSEHKFVELESYGYRLDDEAS
ncbi:clavesin-2-like isoform X2 [Bacillus rossius redtenbacheri]|uniref:clavesin-2-like isoform X2 n=1 Tax=Bacillus rossius redtenbacheri TaxID=93214 RepID=UPI002FDEBD85